MRATNHPSINTPCALSVIALFAMSDLNAQEQAGAVLSSDAQSTEAQSRDVDSPPRIGTLKAGEHNAITDVAGVRVGHTTVISGDDVRTGVTVILPHADNPFLHKVPAAIVTANGFGKLVGSTQVNELGNLEAPIALTNTLSVGTVMDALVGWSLEQEGCESVRSVNVVVGETNDGHLNDIRGRHVTTAHVNAALEAAVSGPVAQGAVGAGTGTVCFSYKGGIGSASRVAGDYTVGVLVQTNYGGELTIAGIPIARRPPQQKKPEHGENEPPRKREDKSQNSEDGSCVIVLATDAPLDARSLRRLAKRAFAGMARTGASFSNGSGDYAIAFSTNAGLREGPTRSPTTGGPRLRNDRLTPLFRAAAEATEQAIVHSLWAATTTQGINGRVVPRLPHALVREQLKQPR